MLGYTSNIKDIAQSSSSNQQISRQYLKVMTSWWPPQITPEVQWNFFLGSWPSQSNREIQSNHWQLESLSVLVPLPAYWGREGIRGRSGIPGGPWPGPGLLKTSLNIVLTVLRINTIKQIGCLKVHQLTNKS